MEPAARPAPGRAWNLVYRATRSPWDSSWALDARPPGFAPEPDVTLDEDPVRGLCTRAPRNLKGANRGWLYRKGPQGHGDPVGGGAVPGVGALVPLDMTLPRVPGSAHPSLCLPVTSGNLSAQMGVGGGEGGRAHPSHILGLTPKLGKQAACTPWGREALSLPPTRGLPSGEAVPGHLGANRAQPGDSSRPGALFSPTDCD